MSRRITRRSFCKSVAAAAGATAAPGVPGCNLLQSFPGESPGLASDWSHRRNFYDFLIVGSGYGGAIMAARLAQTRADLSVCVLV